MDGKKRSVYVYKFFKNYFVEIVVDDLDKLFFL